MRPAFDERPLQAYIIHQDNRRTELTNRPLTSDIHCEFPMGISCPAVRYSEDTDTV